MTGAMYAAIAGLKTHMSKMNVIGNNIANVNTAGYKSQRTVFKDAMYTMYRNGSDGTSTTGGRNPAQIGYGSQVSTIDLNMSSGSYAPGNAMDCMIDGDGFFLVGDKDVANVIDGKNPTSFKSLSLTRVGDFAFDASGYLVDGNGSCVYGFMAAGVDTEGKPLVSDQLVAIRLPKMKTTYTYYEHVKDADGNVTTTEIEEDDYMAGIAGPAEDGVTFSRKANSEIVYPVVTDGDKAIPLKDAEGDLPFAQLDSISIDESTGRISGTIKDSDEWVTIGFVAIGNVTNPNGVTHTGGFYYQAGDGAGDLQISLLGGAAEDLKTINGGMLQYVNGSLAAAGEDDDENAQRLSEKAVIGSAGTTGLLTGGLEGSNVDLATEISEMITTQRGYQANTRIITVTDAMLEELVNMKR